MNSIKFYSILSYHIKQTIELSAVKFGYGTITGITSKVSERVFEDDCDFMILVFEDGCLDIIKWWYSQTIYCKQRLFDGTIRHGNEYTPLTFIRNLISYAASNGHLHVLVWMKEQNEIFLPWPYGPNKAIYNGHIHVFEWCLDQDYHCNSSGGISPGPIYATSFMCKTEDILSKCLKWNEERQITHPKRWCPLRFEVY